MKRLKIYDNFYTSNSYKKPFVFTEVKLKIHKIPNGVNKDKITFRFFNKINNDYTDKCSLMLGCARVIGTKYENNTEIRNIEIGGDKFRKVLYNTVETIILLFLKDLNYTKLGKYEINTISGEKYYINTKKLVYLFTDYFQNILTNAINIGDVIDELKKLKPKIIKKHQDIFDEWLLDKNINKFNI